MPSAPSLNRVPRRPASFASPPSRQQGPTSFGSGQNPDLMNAAVGRSASGNPGWSSPAWGGPPPPGSPDPIGLQSVPGGSLKPSTSPFGGPAKENSGSPVPRVTGAAGTFGASQHPSGTTGRPVLPPSSGAPPGTPDTSAIPLVPADETAKQYALQDYDTTYNKAFQGMGEAAFQYGDPTQMERFGVGTVNPNSALALAALRAQQQQEAATNARGDANTLFSSLAQQDTSKIGAAQDRSDLLGYTNYQKALAKFNAAVIDAQTARDRPIAAANADERAQAIKNLPTGTQASGGFPNSNATGTKSQATGTGNSASGGSKSNSHGHSKSWEKAHAHQGDKVTKRRK